MNLFDDETVTEFEPEPYDDRPEPSNSLQEPQHSSIFVGHNSTEANILSLWERGTFPHALILNGLKGIGKMTFAYRLARFALLHSKNNDNDSLFGDDSLHPTSLQIPADDPVFHKTSSGGHPDLMVISRPYDDKKGRHKDEIPVDDIRKVAPFLRKTSSDGGWRVVIIDDANMMNRNGQNALLKILEEPPKHAVLILVSHGAGGLLPTIRSRCRFIPMAPLDDENVKVLINKHPMAQAVSVHDIDLAATLSNGSVGQAVKLINGTGIDQIRLLLGALVNIKTLTSDQIDGLALSLGKSGDADSIENFIYIINWWFEQIINMSVYQQKTRTLGHIDIQLPEQAYLAKILHLQENVAEHIQTCINGALDKRYMIYKTLRLIQEL